MIGTIERIGTTDGRMMRITDESCPVFFCYEGYSDIFPEKRGSELTDALIALSLEKCGIEGAILERTAEGKPIVNNMDCVFVSVSHSGDLLACVVGKEPLGVDLQHERRIDAEKLARRYFAADEQEYVRDGGTEAFFRLWTRKEAYSKLTGRGLADVMGAGTVLGRSDVNFVDFEIGEGIYVSCCMKAGRAKVK